MDPGAYLTVAGSVIAALVTAAGAVWIARLNTRKDLASTINTGVQSLIDQFQEERESDRKYIGSLREDRAAAYRDIGERDKLIYDRDRTIRKMDTYIDRLERELIKAGVPVPPHDPF